MMPIPLLPIAFTLLIPGYNGFTAHPSKQVTRLSTAAPKPSRPLSKLNILPESVQSSGDARGYFALWFFGGSGGGGVALRQFPLQFGKFQTLFAMCDEGPTQGVDTVGISPLCLYPRDLKKADIDKILSNKLSVVQMVEKGPKPNYLSGKGFLCYESFVVANKDCNPLTIRAVFDAMSTGDNVSPNVAQAYLDEYVNDASPDRAVFKNALLKTKLTGFSSIATLLFLLGPIVGSTCLDALSAGWFPDWPGSDNMPWSLLVGPGLWTIPEYWI